MISGSEALSKAYLVGELDWGLVWGSEDGWRLDVDKGRLLALNLFGRGPVGAESAVAELEGKDNRRACSQPNLVVKEA